MGKKYLAVINAKRVWVGGKDEVGRCRQVPSGAVASNPRPQSADGLLMEGGRILGVFASKDLIEALQRETSSSSVPHQGTPPLPGDLSEGNTQTSDLQGTGFVCPGFVDAHLHFLDSGRLMFKVNLDGCKSRQQFERMVVEQVKTIKAKIGPQQESKAPLIIHGRGWTEAELGLPVGESPTVEWLDHLEGCEDVALVLRRNCLHSLVCNSLALKMFGIDASTPDPTGGRIDRCSDGVTPNGILKEGAVALIFGEQRMDLPEKNELSLAEAQRVLLKQGITQCHHMSAIDYPQSEPELRWLMQADKEGKLKIRVAAATRLQEAEAAHQLWKDHHINSGSETGLLSFGMVKCFLDGALGAKTLAMIPTEEYNSQNKAVAKKEEESGSGKPGSYTSAPETLSPDLKGLMMNGWPDGIMRQAALADSLGLQMSFHAIGDAAVRACIEVADHCKATREKGLLTQMTSLDDASTPSPKNGKTLMLRAVEGVHSATDRRIRVEHCQNVAPVDRERLLEHGMIASMQPLQLIGDTIDSDCMIGVDRSSKSSYAFKSLNDLGIPVAFGSDWMVCFPSVLQTLYTAVRRMGICNEDDDNEDKKKKEPKMKQWNPEQALTPEEALLSSTYWASYAAFQETVTGTLAPGFLADVTILAQDPLEALASLGTPTSSPQNASSRPPHLEDSAAAFEEHCRVLHTIVAGQLQYSSE